ncbi:MAG: RelA/SpoT domain-containing protein [Nitrospirae bacterium]|nr:RelA/SpoT domain-containing protein [Nitrospirota bacterium]
MITIEQLRKDYESSRVLYTDFLKEISNQLKTILENHGVTKIAEISQRVKGFDSIEQNIRNLKFASTIPEHLAQVKDLAGIRIALLFKRYIDPICSSIEAHFEIQKKKYIFHEDDQFGYKSVHYEVRLKRAACMPDIFDKFGNLIAEIQVRTLSQHLWAAASHYMNYKERKDVGKDLLRPLSRMAALLELIDEEYDRLLNQKEEYLIKADISDSLETLNVDLLSKILNEEFPDSKGFALDENMSSILADLFLFEVKTVKDFRNLLNKQKTKVLELKEVAFKIIRDAEPDVAPDAIDFSIQVIIRKMLDFEFSKEDRWGFFEKVSRLPAGTVGKLISTMEGEEGEK